jgi:hypothetical protein
MPSKDRRAGATERTIWLAASTEENRVAFDVVSSNPLRNSPFEARVGN